MHSPFDCQVLATTWWRLDVLNVISKPSERKTWEQSLFQFYMAMKIHLIMYSQQHIKNVGWLILFCCYRGDFHAKEIAWCTWYGLNVLRTMVIVRKVTFHYLRIKPLAFTNKDNKLATLLKLELNKKILISNTEASILK